jgi:nucleoside-diphosphate-sugar epimerase
MTKNILIIGGTRNMGYYLAKKLIESDYSLTILNRGVTQDDLPDTVHRLHADRTDAKQLRRALLAKSFDIVIDFVMFRGEEADETLNIFQGNVGQYVFISTGQVYLVREGIERPFREEDYEGRLMPAPKENTFAYEEWTYGMQKREAEDKLRDAWEQSQFPYTILRLPMVNSGRDQFNRLYNYYLRLQDGGQILVPETPNYRLNHVYALDVVEAIYHLINTGQGKGQAFNIAQDESVSLDEFLSIIGNIMGVKPRIMRLKRSELEANGFLPDCSPFSERWMSGLDNTLSKDALGLTYTSLPDYLTELVEYYRIHHIAEPLTYRRRHAELQFAKQLVQ